MEEDMFRKFELSTAGRVIRIEEKLDKFVTKEEFQKAISELNRRIDEKIAETNRRIDEKTAETNRRIDETNRRIDKLMWLLIGAISGIVGTLITAILNLLK